MTQSMNREIRLASRPEGLPTAANFALAQAELKELQDRQVLVRNSFMSVDPYRPSLHSEQRGDSKARHQWGFGSKCRFTL